MDNSEKYNPINPHRKSDTGIDLPEDSIYTNGYQAGFDDRPQIDNPYRRGTKEAEIWADGHGDGWIDR